MINLNKLLNILKRNFWLKITALLLALLAWIFLIAEQNPWRERTLTALPVKIEGEAALEERDIIIKSGLDTIKTGIRVVVRAQQNNIASVTPDVITAKVDLSAITGAGSHRLPINVTSIYGSAVSVSPGFVEVVADKLATKLIPVQYEFIGALPADYWAGTPELTPRQLEIKGALSDVERISYGICQVTLDGLKKSFTQSFTVKMMDMYGAEVVNPTLTATLPSVMLRLDVLPKKTVPVNTDSIIGSPASGYMIKSVSVLPAEVGIAGDLSVIAAISSIGFDEVKIDGAKETVSAIVPLKAPEGVRLLGASEVRVVVEIGEKQDTLTIANKTIVAAGLARGRTATITPKSSQVTITGDQSVIRRLDSGSIRLYIDAEGLEPGTYNLPVKYTLLDNYVVGSVDIAEDYVRVVIQ